MNRTITIALVTVLIISATLWAASTNAQSIPKPSVPEFTVKYVDRSHDLPATYDIDPYTGKNITTQETQHIQDKIIEVSIKNPAFTPYVDTDNRSINLYYSIQIRGHFNGSWFYLDDGYYGTDNHYAGSDFNSEYTTFQYGLAGNNGTDGLRCIGIPENGQADLQVQAFIGYNTKIIDGITMMGEVSHYVFTGESSDWSQTQTVTLTAPAMANPTITPTDPNTQSGIVPQLNWEKIALVVAFVGIAVLAVAVLALWRRLPKRAK